MIGQMPDVAPPGRVGRARPGLRPGVAGRQRRRKSGPPPGRHGPGSTPKHDCRVNQLALQDDAWRQDTHGEPATAEQDVPIGQGMPTIGSAIPTAIWAS
jgi:hypothetical protein